MLTVLGEWIRRCTYEVEDRMRKLKLDDWVTTQRRRKWRWVQKLANTAEGDWMIMATAWDPTIDDKLSTRRRPGRPKTRWMDNIANYVTTHIQHNNANSNYDAFKATASNMLIVKMASDDAAWAAMEEGFVHNIV